MMAENFADELPRILRRLVLEHGASRSSKKERSSAFRVRVDSGERPSRARGSLRVDPRQLLFSASIRVRHLRFAVVNFRSVTLLFSLLRDREFHPTNTAAD